MVQYPTWSPDEVKDYPPDQARNSPVGQCAGELFVCLWPGKLAVLQGCGGCNKIETPEMSDAR